MRGEGSGPAACDLLAPLARLPSAKVVRNDLSQILGRLRVHIAQRFHDPHQLRPGSPSGEREE